MDNNENYNNNPTPQDAPSMGFAVLGFFIPIAGLILYLVWRETLPKRAKSCIKGAITGFIFWIGITIIATLVQYSMISRYYY